MALDFPDPSSQTYIAPNGITYIWNGTSWVVTAILPTSRGGTGFTTYAHGDILYGDSSKQLNRLAAGTAGQALLTAGAGSDPYWGSVSTGQTIAIPASANILAFYPGTATSLTGSTGIEYTNSSSLLMTVSARTNSQQSLKVTGTPTSSSVPIFSVDGSDNSQFLILNSIAGQNGIVAAINPSSASATWAFLVNNSSQDTRFQVDTKDNLVQLKKGTQLQLFDGAGNYYSGFKATSATANTTYILPPTTPASGTSVLQSDSGGVMSWVQMSSGGGAGTVSTANQYQISGYYAGNGSSVNGSSTFTNDTSAGIVSITHATVSTSNSTGALTVSGGVGVGGSIWSGQHIITDTTASTGYSTGALVVYGGVGLSGGLFVGGTAVTFFRSVANNYFIMNSGNNVLRIQTDSASSRVRMFENMTTSGTLGFFGTSGGTLYLGTDSGTQNGPITIRGNNTTGGGGNQIANTFTLATATSNGIGTGGTIIFQTSTSSSVPSSITNVLRTRLRIEGAATGTSNYESIIILGDTNSGTAWTSYLRGVDATGNDVSSGEIQIQAGRSTGAGVAQGISFYVSSSGAGAAVLNTANQIGRFSATGLTIYSSTASISTTTGALIVVGGVGIGGSLNVGALSKYSDHVEIKTAKELRFYNGSDTQYIGIKAGNVSSSNKTFTLPLDYGSSGQYLSTDGSGTLSWMSGNGTVGTGSQYQVALYSSVGNSVVGSSTLINDTANSQVVISHPTSSTASTNGALVVSGGVGIGGSLRIGGTIDSGGTTTGTLIVAGGVGVAKNMYVGGLLQVSSTTNLFGAVTFQNELSTATFQNRIIKSGSINLSMSGATLNGAVLQIQQANIKETGIGGTTTVSTVVPAISFRKQTFSASKPNITFSKAANVYIEDAPNSSVDGAVGGGTGTTYTVALTDSYALYVESGRTYMGGALDAPGSYRCSIGLATSQTITATDAVVNFTDISDPNNWWDATTKKFTPTIAGWYYFNYQANWAAASITNAQCNIQMRKNATTFSIGQMQLLSGSPYSMSCSGMVYLNGTTDYVDFTAYSANTTSHSLTGESNQQYTKVDMFKIQ